MPVNFICFCRKRTLTDEHDDKKQGEGNKEPGSGVDYCIQRFLFLTVKKQQVRLVKSDQGADHGRGDKKYQEGNRAYIPVGFTENLISVPENHPDKRTVRSDAKCLKNTQETG